MSKENDSEKPEPSPEESAIAKAKQAAKLLAARKAQQAKAQEAREHLSRRNRGGGDAGKPTTGSQGGNLKRSGSQKRGS